MLGLHPAMDLIWKGGCIETCFPTNLSSSPLESRLLSYKDSPQNNLEVFDLKQILLSEEEALVKRIVFGGLRSVVARDLSIEQLQKSVQEWFRSLISSQ